MQSPQQTLIFPLVKVLEHAYLKLKVYNPEQLAKKKLEHLNYLSTSQINYIIKTLSIIVFSSSMQNNHKQLLKTLIKANAKDELAQSLTSLSPSIKGRSTQLLRIWNTYLCRYIRTKQQSKTKEIIQIMRKVLHFFSLMGEIQDPYIPILISNNGAAISESQWNFAEAESCLEAMLEYIDSCILKILSGQDPQFARAAQLKRLQVKVRLQLAGVYSQLQKHQKAIMMADSAIRLIYQFCININIQIQNLDMPQSFNIQKSKQSINLIIQEGEPEKVITNQSLQKIRLQLCAWKRNTEISSIHIKKLIQNTKHKTSALSNFQIGDIMQVASMLSCQFPTKQTIFDMIVEEQLEELIIQLSVGYFTLGTELYYQKSKKDKKTLQKYKDTFQNVYKKQQLFHLQALTLAVNAISFETPYVQHLIKVFNDNYNGLHIIEETLKQESNSSIRIDDLKLDQTPIKNLYLHSKNQTAELANDPLLDASTDLKMRKKSIEVVRNKRSHMSPVPNK